VADEGEFWKFADGGSELLDGFLAVMFRLMMFGSSDGRTLICKLFAFPIDDPSALEPNER